MSTERKLVGPARKLVRSERKLVIIGLMGAGKSTVAGALASRLGVSTVDTDAYLEAQTGTSVAEIFATQGEPAFRTMECNAVRDVLAQPGPAIVSLGGGAFMSPDVRDACAGCPVVYLHATPEALIARLQQTERRLRPLLKGNWPHVIREMYTLRDPVYRAADVVVETSADAADQVVDAVAAIWEAPHV